MQWNALIFVPPSHRESGRKRGQSKNSCWGMPGRTKGGLRDMFHLLVVDAR